MEESRTHTWEGVYRSFTEVPSSRDPHNDDTWTHLLLEALSSAVSALTNKEPIPGINPDEKNLLPFLVSVVADHNNKPVSILDFGGGLGVDFLYAVKSLGEGVVGKYIIVETENVCRLGARLYHHDTHVRFSTEVPSDAVDIVYLDSSLQYVEDWRGLISRLALCRPDYFLFVRTPVGGTPTYVSAQMNIPGCVIPYRFINSAEFTGAMVASGFGLIFSGTSGRTYDQSNFPPGFRLGATSTMLFKRIAEG